MRTGGSRRGAAGADAGECLSNGDEGGSESDVLRGNAGAGGASPELPTRADAADGGVPAVLAVSPFDSTCFGFGGGRFGTMASIATVSVRERPKSAPSVTADSTSVHEATSPFTCGAEAKGCFDLRRRGIVGGGFGPEGSAGGGSLAPIMVAAIVLQESVLQKRHGIKL